jgi:hypothetical protein
LADKCGYCTCVNRKISLKTEEEEEEEEEDDDYDDDDYDDNNKKLKYKNLSIEVRECGI